MYHQCKRYKIDCEGLSLKKNLLQMKSQRSTQNKRLNALNTLLFKLN